MYVCMYTHTHIHIKHTYQTKLGSFPHRPVHVCAHVDTYISMYICMYVYRQTYTDIHTHICIYIYIHTQIHIKYTYWTNLGSFPRRPVHVCAHVDMYAFHFLHFQYQKSALCHLNLGGRQNNHS